MTTRKSKNRIVVVSRRALVALLCLGGLALAFVALRNAAAQGQSSNPPAVQGIYRGLSPVVKFDVSPPLREMQPILGPGQLRENEDREILPWKVRFAPELDPVAQSVVGGKDTSGGAEIPAPIITFNAQPNVNGVVPPDPNGTVGPNHVVTMVNLTFQIFDKSGNSLFGPANNNTLWAGFGGDCQTDNSGDPVVLYDRAADRWVLSQFTASGPTFFECVAVSTTNDPTGSYFRYAIATGTNFPDYPKAGVWPDAYYFSTREFLNTGPFAGVGAYALNRAQALAGNPNPQIISFLVPPDGTGFNVGDGLLPSDMDGATPPPAGSPNFYVGSQDNNGPYGAPFDALNLYVTTRTLPFRRTRPLHWPPPFRPRRLTPSWDSAPGAVTVFLNREPPSKSTISVTGNAHSSVWPIVTLVITKRWSPISPSRPAMVPMAKSRAFAGGRSAIPMAPRPFSRRAPMHLDLPTESIAGWEASRWTARATLPWVTALPTAPTRLCFRVSFTLAGWRAIRRA